MRNAIYNNEHLHNKSILFKVQDRRGITLVALVITIIIIIILSTVSINAIFGDNGLITMAQIAKNESEVAVIKESLNMYYLGNSLREEYEDPIGEQVLKDDITDNKTLETIVEYQYGVDSIENINFSNLYYLDLGKLNLTGIKEKRYFMDISTNMVFVNEGIQLHEGKIYILEAKEIMPIKLEAEETEQGFKLIASLEDTGSISRYTFYINNEKYKEINTNAKTVEIEVTEYGFETLECTVQGRGTSGEIYVSNNVNVDNYVIKTTEDFDKFRSRVEGGETFEGKRIRIANDIDLGGSKTNQNWIAIGSESHPFSGTLEGNNHKIINLYNRDTTSNSQGIIGYAENATMQNITIESGKLEGGENVGGIIGNATDTQIINCKNGAQIIAQRGNAGGVIGKALGTSTIEGCSNSGDVSSQEYTNDVKDTFIGGVIGYLEGNISNSENAGNITSVYSATGGVAGITYGTVNNCNNAGKVTVTGQNVNGDATIGGVIGYVANGSISGCNNNGSVESEGNGVGGISGITVNTNISNCSNMAVITQNNGYKVGGIVGLFTNKGKIEDCTNEGKLAINSKGDSEGIIWAGGIAGHSINGEIIDCINKGEINSNGSYVGGIAGTSNCKIEKSHNEGNIEVNIGNNNNSCAGGIVGQLNGNNTSDAKIENCYNIGTIHGKGDHVGGIASAIIRANISNSYNTGNIISDTGIVGGIAGDVFQNENGELANIENCYNTGKIEAKGIAISSEQVNSFSGGIAGGNKGNILKCWNSGEIKGISAVGGIAGTSGTYVSNCYNKGDIISEKPNVNGRSNIGGVIGYSYANSITEYCYNTGKVISDYNNVGGLVGVQTESSIIRNSYNTYNIQETTTRSSLVGGKNSMSEVVDCYYLGDTTSDSSRTEDDMKTIEFINLIGGETIWKLDSNNINNGFVILSWQ